MNRDAVYTEASINPDTCYGALQDFISPDTCWPEPLHLFLNCVNNIYDLLRAICQYLPQFGLLQTRACTSTGTYVPSGAPRDLTLEESDPETWFQGTGSSRQKAERCDRGLDLDQCVSDCLKMPRLITKWLGPQCKQLLKGAKRLFQYIKLFTELPESLRNVSSDLGHRLKRSCVKCPLENIPRMIEQLFDSLRVCDTE